MARPYCASPDRATHEIRLDGELLVWGDDTSCRVIFRNLAGMNNLRDLEGYREMMLRELKIPGWNGVLTLCGPHGETMATHSFELAEV